MPTPQVLPGTPGAAQATGPQPPKGVKLVKPGDTGPPAPLSEDQQILLAQGPGEGASVQDQMQSANARIQGSTLPVSTKMLRMLPALREAASDPSLPSSVRDIYRTTVLGIESRVKQNA